MSSFSITSFQSVQTGIASRSEEISWSDFLELFNEHNILEAKENGWLFSGTRFEESDAVLQRDVGGCFEHPVTGEYTVRRLKQNVIDVQLLIIDYDGTMSIAEAQDRFKSYTYLGYTSHGHLKTPGIEKFRLVFPLVKPIPAHYHLSSNGTLIDQGVFYDLSDAILAFAPECDPASVRPTQPYYIPSVPQDRLHLAQLWSNEGEVLDWSSWQTNQPDKGGYADLISPKSSAGAPSRMLDGNQEFRVRNRIVKADEVTGRINDVTCPFHDDDNGTEFLARYPSGLICFHCKHCGSYVLPPEKINQVGADPAMVVNPDIAATQITDLLIFDDADPFKDDETPWDHNDRKRVSAFLSSVKYAVLADTGFDPTVRKPNRSTPVDFASHILRLPEGAGKSRLALEFLKEQPQGVQALSGIFAPQIIIACKSWDQALEKYTSFLPALKEIGRTAKIAWSLGGRIQKRFGTKISRERGKPFYAGKIRKEDTINEILKKNKNLSREFVSTAYMLFADETESFSEMAIPDIRFDGKTGINGVPLDDNGHEPPAIIFTTIAQLRLLSNKHDAIPLNWIIWVDDPDIDEFIDIKLHESGSDGPTCTINGTTYHRRPENTALGLSFPHHRTIYTTTEDLVVKFLEKMFKDRGKRYQLHGERYAVTGGRITILGTKIVQKKYDAILPLFAKQLNYTLIADGTPADFNHSTNKGRNDLAEKNIIVKLSQPHPFAVKTICDALGLNFDTHRHEILGLMMIDRMHQAIGRNAGYRTKGAECIVLVDSKKHRQVVDACKYTIDMQNSVLIDRTQRMARGKKRITASASASVVQLEELINQPGAYIADINTLQLDFDEVWITLETKEKRQAYLIRFLVALTSFSQVRFDVLGADFTNNSVAESYWTVGSWVIDIKMTDDERPKMLFRYQQEVDKVRA